MAVDLNGGARADPSTSARRPGALKFTPRRLGARFDSVRSAPKAWASCAPCSSKRVPTRGGLRHRGKRKGLGLRSNFLQYELPEPQCVIADFTHCPWQQR